MEQTTQPEVVVNDPSLEASMPSSGKGKLIGIGIGVLVILGLVIGGGVFAFKKIAGPTATPTPAPSKRVVEPKNVIPVDQRPVVYIVPEADGRNLTIEVETVKKQANRVEYELEYQTGELLQGFNGFIDLLKLPAKKTELMGSCSAGGKCSFHENVQGGLARLRFMGDENYLLEQDWRYINNAANENLAGSKDAKFQLSSSALRGVRYIVVYNSPGYPEGAPGRIISESYALRASSVLNGEGELTIRANEDGASAVAGWDGKEWHLFEGAVDGHAITATVDLMQLYVAIDE